MCRGSSLYWSGVLVGVFFVNSADKLNMLQLGGHITTCSSSFVHLTKLLEFVCCCCGPLCSVHARSYLSALAVSFKRQPPLHMEEEAHWAHA